MNENHNFVKKITLCAIKEVQSLFTLEPLQAWATKQINLLREALGKPKPHIITIEDLKSYFRI